MFDVAASTCARPISRACSPDVDAVQEATAGTNGDGAPPSDEPPLQLHRHGRRRWTSRSARPRFAPLLACPAPSTF